MNKRYQAIDHTGDIGVEVWGRDYPELFESASLALADTLVEIDQVLPKQQVEWSLEAASMETLLVKQLHEIIYQLDANGLIFHDFSVAIEAGPRLRCRARGEALERVRHRFKTELKAVTYHQLKIRREEGGGYAVRLIFDV
jgi:SHS2 domain-containing protein